MNSTPNSLVFAAAIFTCLTLSSCELLTTQRPKLPLNPSTAIEPIPPAQKKAVSNDAPKPKSELYPSTDYAMTLPAATEQAAQKATGKKKQRRI